MLQAIIIYILTILISFVFQVSMALDTIKYLADHNYKINMDNLENIDLDKNNILSIRATIFFPFFFNILSQFKYLNDYFNNKFLIIDEFRILDVLEEMTIEEIKDYESNPTLLNALTIMMGQNKNQIASIRYGGKLNTIIYSINKETKELEIIKIIGDLKNKDKDEQKRILIEYLENKDIINDTNKINHNLDNNKKLDNIDRDLESLKVQKEKLESYVNELKNNSNDDKKDIKTLSKKKKKY